MKRLLAVALLITLSACALPQERSRTFSPYAPLQAYITGMSTSGPLFHVNRPAYVAMFYIVPGSGVRMLYPGFGSGSLSGRVFAGSHFATGRSPHSNQFVFTRSGYLQPRYYFLIASDRPLNVQQFGTFGDLMQSRLGTHFASFSAYSTMEELVSLTLPSLADDGSWTTDMYVDWPSVIHTEPGRGRVLVACDGYAMYVPAEYVRAVQGMMCNREVTPDDREVDAEKRPVRPGTREPLPADDEEKARDAVTPGQRAAIRERVASSSQLAAPSYRDPAAVGSRDYGSRAFGDGPAVAGAARSGEVGRRAAPSGAERPSSRSPAASPAGAAASRPAATGARAAPSARPAAESGGGSAPSRGARSAPTRD